MLTPLSAARSQIIRSLQKLHGAENVKQSKGEVAWIVTRAAWLGFRWAHVSYVSGCPPDFIRLRNDLAPVISKSF